jgi:catechol 2,3-dioxygenase-like lactoylglutathione lyase family enzyme
MGSVRIERLDHLVLTVADIDATVEFYTRVRSTLRRPRSAVLAWAGRVCSRIARFHLQGVNRGAGASASMTAWW